MLPKKNINKTYKILILGGSSYVAGFFIKSVSVKKIIKVKKHLNR